MHVEVFAVPLVADPECVAALEALLSPDERARAARFAFPHLTRRFIVKRGALRLLLASYVGAKAEDVVIESGRGGKPFVRGGALEFNVSDSEDLALFAFARGVDLGVDLERIREVRDLDGVARRFFAAGEITELLKVAPDERSLAFLRCWTRKEAYVKAIGDGLLAPLDAFEVAIGEQPALRQIDGSAGEARRWSMLGLALEPDYVAALAIRVPNAESTLRHITVEALLSQR